MQVEDSFWDIEAEYVLCFRRHNVLDRLVQFVQATLSS